MDHIPLWKGKYPSYIPADIHTTCDTKVYLGGIYKKLKLKRRLLIEIPICLC